MNRWLAPAARQELREMADSPHGRDLYAGSLRHRYDPIPMHALELLESKQGYGLADGRNGMPLTVTPHAAWL